MKKKILFTLIIFLVPFIVKANSVYLQCDNNTVSGGILNCSVKGETTSTIIGVTIKVRTGSNITFKSFTAASIWQGDGDDGKIDLYTANDIINNFNIGTISLNVNSLQNGADSFIALEQVTFYDIDGIEMSVDSYRQNIRIASSDNNLSSLSINIGSLSPIFSSSITNYSTTINSSQITITAKASNSNAKVTGTGTKNLDYGNNTFRVNVTSESGSTKTYTINIIRPEPSNNDNNTNNNNNNNNNNSNTNNNNNNNNSNSNSNNNNSNSNNNNQNQNTTTESKSNNTYLKSLTLNPGNIDFNKDILEYNISVSNDIKEIKVEAIPEDSKSKVEVKGNNDLQSGNNKIEITVTSEDSSTRTYIVNVNKKEDNTLSSNNNISKLTIKKYNIDFDKNIQNYNLKIRSDKSLDIDVELEDPSSKYVVEGNNNLKNNSTIKIIVTSEDNSTKTYTINITTNHKKVIMIFQIIIALLLSINMFRVIYKLNQRSNYERKNLSNI